MQDFDIMLDVETLGKKPGCAVVSVGAVKFNPRTGVTGEEFYSVMDVATQPDCYADPGTMKWWRGLNAEAQTAFIQAWGGNAPQARDVLSKFKDYCGLGANAMWSQGTSFDMPILEHLWSKFPGLGSFPVPFYLWQDTRTIYRAARVDFRNFKGGTHHNVLDDARSQVCAVTESYSRLGANA